MLRTATAAYKSSGNDEQDSKSTASSAPPASRKVLLHKSHKFHDAAAGQLEIRIILSPSCRKCCVDVIRTETNSGEHGNGSEGEPGAKRRRTSLDSEAQQQTAALSPGGALGESKEQDMNTVSSSSESTSTSTSNLPMKDSEIMGALCKALPTIASCNDDRSNVEDCFLSEPVGDVLEEYSNPATEKAADNLSKSDSIENDKIPSSQNFVLTIADGRLPRVSEYHRSIQKLALFYIENADNVDVANDGDGGFWKIMYIFQKHDGDGDDDDDYDKEKKRSRYSLVGYFTLFHFIALFHKPNPGLILRICQALILPPFQGQGHGRRLLQAVYNLAHKDIGQVSASEGYSQYHNIIEVNVEDPAPAFVALRNKMDLKLVREHYEEWKWSEKGSIWSSDLCQSLAPHDKLALFFSAMAEKDASEMSVKAKITPKQIHVANELLKLKTIHAASSEQQRDRISNAAKDTIERLFRLMVKRRLNKEHRDELLEQPTKDGQKALLAKLFDKELEGYERILSKLHS